MNRRDALLEKIRLVVELNLRDPLVKDDVRLTTPGLLAHRRGVKVNDNTLLIITLNHLRPRLTWKLTVSWPEIRYFEPEIITELASMVLTGPEMAIAQVDIPTDSEVPMATLVADYVPVISEDEEYESLTRMTSDHADFCLRSYLGMDGDDEDIPNVLEATPQELIAFSGNTPKPVRRA